MATAISRIEKLADLQTLRRSDLIETITEGLSAVLARELAARLAVTMEEMTGLLRLTSRTMQRRLEDGSLGMGESERLWELARLLLRAIAVLESEAAVQWFKSPIQVLGWATPIFFAHTAVFGLRELENILGRIEHGVFS